MPLAPEKDESDTAAGSSFFDFGGGGCRTVSSSTLGESLMAIAFLEPGRSVAGAFLDFFSLTGRYRFFLLVFREDSGIKFFLLQGWHVGVAFTFLVPKTQELLAALSLLFFFPQPQSAGSEEQPFADSSCRRKD